MNMGFCCSCGMFLRFYNCVKKLHSLASISKTKTMNLDKCYFRYVQEEEKVDICFLLNVKNSVRQFNFSRKPSEQLETLLARIGTNINKAIMKGNKKNSTDNSQVVVKIYDDKNNEITGSSTCMDLFALKTPVKLQVLQQVYEAVFNVPWVVSLHLPCSILAGFPVYPEHFVLQHADKSKCKYDWFRGYSLNEKGNEIIEHHIKWELIGEGFMYLPTNNDVGMKLKLECTPGNGEEIGPTVAAISKSLVEAGPGMCPFETRHKFTSTKLKDKSFRCVTYNILADLYCDSDFTRTFLHPYCPAYALHFDYRKQLIIKELLGYNADIVCLQEVDRKMFNHYLSPLMDLNNFQGQFYRKGKEVAEGLACYFNTNRFGFIDEEKILLSEAIKTKPCLQHIWDGIKDNNPLVERLLDRSTVASATILKSLENPEEILIVGNTHLYFHPDSDHIRLIQGGICIYWLIDVRKNIMKKFPGKRISVILCGDFNSVPSCGIFELYTKGVASMDLADWKSNEKEAIHGLSLEQELSLGSACGTPPFTNFTAGFADCLDYIFYDKSTLQVEQVVPLPSEEELKANIALPSVVFPSDHIALISDLSFI